MRTFPILVSFDGKPPLVTGGGELGGRQGAPFAEARALRRHRRR